MEVQSCDGDKDRQKKVANGEHARTQRRVPAAALANKATKSDSESIMAWEGGCSTIIGILLVKYSDENLASGVQRRSSITPPDRSLDTWLSTWMRDSTSCGLCATWARRKSVRCRGG